ncbi:RNA 2'-phosphotransferase [Lysinibacillus sp. fkY74-1]|uniref:RNA 2'-phosphotransferase n=1 Tax=Lysinibacillus TaxID=400634 RepID=UPI0005621494|nr:RNA 2'-phosphotransferase [Lysinibacillus sphaericus]
MNYDKLSKEVAYALRHSPGKYELELDANGWVSVDQLLESLRKSDKWSRIEIDDLKKMIEKSEKKRYEILDDKIRAFYGHSTPMKIQKKEMKPPSTLYHGTSRRFLESIIKNGLVPKTRQYVHLSEDIHTAILVGKRRDTAPIVLKINSEDAYKNGVKFYFAHETIWLADAISYDFISY